MKLELIGSSYYVNSQRISRETLRTILIEIWNEETFNFIVEKLRSNGVFNITWHGNRLVKNIEAELKEALKNERAENKILKAKFNAAVQLALLNLQSA